MKIAIGCLLCIALLANRTQANDTDGIPPGCDLRVSIGPDKSVEFLMPCLNKDQLVDILASFISQENPTTKDEAAKALKQANEISLTLTTNHHPK